MLGFVFVHYTSLFQSLKTCQPISLQEWFVIPEKKETKGTNTSVKGWDKNNATKSSDRKSKRSTIGSDNDKLLSTFPESYFSVSLQTTTNQSCVFSRLDFRCISRTIDTPYHPFKQNKHNSSQASFLFQLEALIKCPFDLTWPTCYKTAP